MLVGGGERGPRDIDVLELDLEFWLVVASCAVKLDFKQMKLSCE